MGRRNAFIAVSMLALGLAGVALAGIGSGPSPAAGSGRRGSGMGGPGAFSSTGPPAGKVTLVVVNKGTTKHALAIMGETMSPKRTPNITAGGTARLTVTLAAGKYHMWDPVTSSMSRAKFITVKAPISTG